MTEDVSGSDLAATAGPIGPCWEIVLAQIEDDLARFDDAVLGPDVEVLEQPEWRPPEGLGPLPPELAPRARTVLARLRTASARASDELQALKGQQEQVGRRRQAGNAYAAAGK